MSELRIRHQGQVYQLAQRQTLVGRSRRCTIVLSSRLASREHCVLERSGAALTLIELGSKNGTWVNGERVTRRRQLATGDEIRIGSDHLEVIENVKPEGEPRRVEADGTAVLLVRQGENLYALAETCAHMGGPLSEGKLEDGCVICPWHGSRFALDDGRVLDGPSTFPQPRLETRVRDGQIEVKAAAREREG